MLIPDIFQSQIGMRKVGERKDRDSEALCDGEWAPEFWSYLSREFGEFVDFDLKPGFCEAEAVLLQLASTFEYSALQSGLFCKHNTSCVSVEPRETKQRFVSLGECGPLHIHIPIFSVRLDIPTYRSEWLLPPKHFLIPATPSIAHLHWARWCFIN